MTQPGFPTPSLWVFSGMFFLRGLLGESVRLPVVRAEWRVEWGVALVRPVLRALLTAPSHSDRRTQTQRPLGNCAPHILTRKGKA